MTSSWPKRPGRGHGPLSASCPTDLIPGGLRRAADLREIEPVPLEEIREHLPVSRLRFGFFELDAVHAEAIRARIIDRGRPSG